MKLITKVPAIFFAFCLIQSTLVSSSIRLNGSTMGGHMTFAGLVEAKESKFTGLVEVDGDLISDKSTFLSDIVLTGNLVARDSVCKSAIKIKNSEKEKSEVFLMGRTVIEGAVIFENEPGDVWAAPTVIIRKGVVNGTLNKLVLKTHVDSFKFYADKILKRNK